MKQVHLNRFLSKKMTRTEFLAYLGIFIFALSGISGILERIEKTQKPERTVKVKRGFGTGPYGV